MRRPITRESLLATRPHTHKPERAERSETAFGYAWEWEYCECGCCRVNLIDTKGRSVGSWT